MLITGGLIVIGVLILVAAFFLSRGDTAPSQASNVNAAPVAASQQAPTIATPVKAAASAPQPELMNGQVHEIAGQLQKLQEQSQELGRRLELLNTMVMRIEQNEANAADQ